MNTFRIKPIKVKLAENNTVETVQITRTGTFNHPEYGTFKITKDTLESFRKNFSDKVRGIDLAIDYSHDSDKEAAGWIKDLFLNEDGTELWAKVDWTPDGKAAIEGKKYRYLSADFTFDYLDDETQKKFGPTLLGAGLTNRPFVKNMAPAVELKEGEIYMTLDEAMVEIKKLSDEIVTLKDKSKDVPDEDMLKKMKKLEEDLNAALAENKELKEKYAADKKASEKKGEFDKLMSEGKVVEAQRECFMKDDMAGFIKLAQKLNLTPAGSGEGGEGKSEKKSAQDEVIEKAEKLLSDKKATTIREAQKMVLAEDAELAKKYLAEVEV